MPYILYDETAEILRNFVGRLGFSSGFRDADKRRDYFADHKCS
jgi:hypothetical protein